MKRAAAPAEDLFVISGPCCPLPFVTISGDVPTALTLKPKNAGRRSYMGDCQNYGPFLGPYYNTGPNTGPNLRDPKRDHTFDNPPHARPEMIRDFEGYTGQGFRFWDSRFRV